MAATPALAHYGMIIPNDPMISQEDGRNVALTMSFSHPFETGRDDAGQACRRFSVTHEGHHHRSFGQICKTPR